jgi:Na+-transporting methylmalonyl-CoA/oxaloacetate decarboxylase gamma subunit
MRVVFGVLSLLIVVAIVGVLARKQLSAGVAPAAGPAPAEGVALPSGTPKQQVQQFQQAVEGALNQPRPMPEDK